MKLDQIGLTHRRSVSIELITTGTIECAIGSLGVADVPQRSGQARREEWKSK